MLATALLVLVISITAEIAGPGLSGMVSSFPVIATVVGSFTQHRYGAAAVTRLFRGLLISLSGFVVFFLVVSQTLASRGLVASYVLAILAGLLVSALLLAVNRWRSKG
jgi:pilus assembly protein TadC